RVDDSGLDARHDIVSLPRDRVASQRIHELNLFVVPRPGEELHALELSGMNGSLLGEETYPSEIAPEKGHETSVGKAFFEKGSHPVPDVFDFIQRSEHHGQVLERVDRFVDFGEPDYAQHRGLELPYAHAADHVGLTAHIAV